jgi:hypothetical protein
MKAGLMVAMELIRLGVLRVDAEGRIWKEKEVRNTGALVPVWTRRAEHANKKNGYLYVTMRFAGRQFCVQAHQIVWVHFKGEIPAGREINHGNGTKHDNHPRNLEPLTRGKNHEHAYRTGLRRPARALPPETRAEARRLRAAGLSFATIARKLGISQTAAFRHGTSSTEAA